MSWWKDFLYRLGRMMPFGSDRVSSQVSDEVAHHLELLTEENIAKGMPPREAREAAMRQFGNPMKFSQEMREITPAVRFEQFRQDLAYGARMLLKTPGFTFVAIITLALGIGSNAAIFSAVNEFLLRPLPLPDSHQLYFVSESGNRGVSYPSLRDWQQQQDVFTGISAYTGQSVNLTGDGEPERIIGAFVSANYMQILGVQPKLGRDFLRGEDIKGAAPVVILGHGLWERRFGSDPKLVGKMVTLNGQGFTVIGIASPNAIVPFPWDAFLPIPFYPNYNDENRSFRAMGAVARLKPGVSIDKADAAMDVIAKRIQQLYPGTEQSGGVDVQSMHELTVGDARLMLLALFGATALVLLIACANVANLLLARGSTRMREITVRAALGAGRDRLVRQLLTESLLLGIIGGLLGLFVAYAGIGALRQLAADEIPAYIHLSLDWQVTLFAFGTALLTTALFGLVPAFRLSRPNLATVLSEGRSAGQLGRSHHRLRAALVAGQVALALILMVSAGLMLKTLARLNALSPGFDYKNLLTFEYRLPRNKYPTGQQQWEFHRRTLESIKAIPGVKEATLIRGLPFSGNGAQWPITFPDRPAAKDGEEFVVIINSVEPNTFKVMGIPFFKGRTFAETDSESAPPVIVVNQAMAEKAWPGEDPLSKQIQVKNPEGKLLTMTVIGVVGNIKQYQIEEEWRPHVYTYYPQDPFIFVTMVARTSVEPMTLQRAAHEAVWKVDPDQPIWKVRTIETLLYNATGPRRFFMKLIGAFAGLALILSVIGIYGVISWLVNQRTQEFGIRMALGAKPGDVLRHVLGQGARLTLIGVAVGVVGAIAASRLLKTLLYEVSTTDPATIALVSALLAAVALLACFIPARRATRVDPMEALRYE